MRFGFDRTGRIVIAMVVTGLVLTGAPVGADPLTFANCYRHRVCRNDDTRPRLRISTPAYGSHVARTFWIRGTARDNVKLARVIVRLDGGRWRRAEGRSTWRFPMRGLSYGWHTIRVRAIDFARNKRTRNVRVYVRRPTTSLPLPTFTDPPTPALPTGATYGPPAVAADCSVDVSTELNTWLSSIPNNSTVLFAPSGCYRVETGLTMARKDTLLIDGQGSLFRRFNLSPPELRYPQGNRHWRFDGGSNITIRNMSVQGTNTSDPACQGVEGAQYVRDGYSCYVVDMEFEHGLAIHGVQTARVENVDVRAVWGDGILIMPCIGTVCGSYQGLPARNVTVTDVQVELNGRQGIAISGSRDLLFDDARIMSSRRAGFDLEPPPGDVRGVEIRNSYVNSHLLAFASAGTGRVDNVFIHHNTIEASGVPVVYVNSSDGARRYNWRIEDNNSLRPRVSPMASMLFTDVTGVIIRRNIWPVHTTASRKSVEFRNATGTLTLLDNDFSGACRSYVRDSLTTTVTASGNIVSSDC